MKNLILLTAALLLVLFANAQIVNIPDANFKAELVGNILINTNMDAEIQVSEATAYTGEIYVPNKNISDFTGIEAFTALTELWCYSNQLTVLDISNNAALTELRCHYNQINTLDLSNNIALAVLECYSNPLNTLNLNNNISLTKLYCAGNLLTSLDISNNTNLNELSCYQNQLSSLDISNNIYLTYVACSSNQLTTLDISNNINLTHLNCYMNQLSNLDVSNNPALIMLTCSNNQLSTLDLSNNPALTDLSCSNNQLSTLDVNNNPVLTDLSCYYNQLISLDVSNNLALTSLRCYDNQLSSLNVKNGNNINFTSFYATNNPDLFCIEVDDPIWSIANWINIDSQTSFGNNCLYGIADPNEITGKVVIDTNCVIDGTEQALGGIIVKTGPNEFYGMTNSLGEYSIYTDTGTYQVEQIIPIAYGLLIDPLCPTPNYHTVHFDSLGMDVTGIDFFNEVIACPILTIDINSDRRRRCFTNNTYVHYCNDGFADETGVEVHVQLPDYVIFISANYPYTIDTLGNYVFDIGSLVQGDCGDIHIIDSVACINGITGLTQCTEAWITPPNDCANSLDTVAYNAWDKSSVMVEGECIGDTIVRFTITNTGDLGNGDMQVASEYRIYEDNTLVYTGSFQLLGQEELVIDIPANGHTYRLEADQHPMHPGNNHPNETIEACGNPYTGSGFVNTMPQDDEDAEIEIDCMEIRDSYDPNDKSVSPQGITANNYVMPGTSLDYVIRFQNTGSDTAFTVIVVDTLSSHLDISTFQAIISSHPYILDVRGQVNPVLFFQFFNINLPDSTTDEANSHGFVKFKIAPYDTLAMGTIVENTADIYFDYNLPVITNTTSVIISDTVLIGNPIVIYGIDNDFESQITDIKIYPNPTTGKVTVKAEGIIGIEVMDITGKNLQGFQNLEGLNEIDLSQNPKGIYIIKVTTEHGVGIKKIVKQ